MPENFETTGSEQDFLDRYKRQEIHKYEKPSVTVDCVMLRYHEGKVQLLLIKRKAHPFKDRFALPGGFVDKDEDLTDAVLREVEEETHIQLNPQRVEQLITVGTPHRDPRHWVITVAYLVYLTPNEGEEACAGDDAKSLHWVDMDCTPDNQLVLSLDGQIISPEETAFDHWDIIKQAFDRIRGRLEWRPSILHILPKRNSIKTYRELFGRFDHAYKNMNSSTFRRKYDKHFKKTQESTATATRKATLYEWEL